MSWYFIIRNDSGNLASEASVVPEGIDADVYEVRDMGIRPDWSVKQWNTTTKSMIDRPFPILTDRLDDIQAWFLADADFAAVWATINATRKTQLRLGIMRVLAQLIGTRRFRQDDESVELDY